ncbi:MAG TPA: protein kinase [Gemmataceae bacterium]|nr:protein kinase [Gemmataceae bacterium]
MATANADRNLLFGILALQMDFISREGLITAMNAWVLEKSRPLGQLLQQRGDLTPERHNLVEALVQEHLRAHGNDPQRSLAAVRSLGPMGGDVQQITDPDLQASLALLARTRAPDEDLDATRLPETRTLPESGPRFRIVRFHREGGLGQVFVARDEELHREVALKQIKEQYADHAEYRSRFILEAEITGNLEHPGIVPVYGLGTYADGRPYYAMRFIQGDSFKAAIDHFHHKRVGADAPGSVVSRRLELRHLLDRFLDVCNAIAYAHNRGILHRDLKPANVMLGPYGETLVVDWGLAKALSGQGEPGVSTPGVLRPALAGDSAPTRMGSAIGTPQYMSPEQAAGRLDLLGQASDVYSLGATLYTVLTGRAPFADAGLEAVLEEVQHGDFPRPRRLDPRVPAALEAVCLKAMALAPEARYASARHLAEDIERWLADEPVRAWREPWTVTTRRWLARHRTLVTATAAVGLVALAILSWATVRLNAAKGRLTQQLDETTAARARADANLYVAEMNLAHRAWEDGRVARVLELLRAQRRGPDLEDLRGFEWYYLRGLCHRDRLTVRGRSCVAFSLDGRLFAAAGANHAVNVWDVATGKELPALVGHQAEVTAVAFSPDGKHLASASEDKTVRIWDVHSAKVVHAPLRHTAAVRTVAYDRDGKRLAAAGNDREITLWDPETGKETRTPLRGHTSHVLSVAFSPDGRHLASGSADATVRIWDLKTGKDRTLHSTKTHLAVLSVAFNPQDGTRLVSGNGDGSVAVWDVAEDTDDNLALIHQEGGGHSLSVAGVAYSPDGKRIASVSWDMSVKIWHAEDAESPPVTLRGHIGWVTGVAFSPDGKWLASAGGDNDRTVKVWDAALTDQEARTVGGGRPGHRTKVNSVTYDSASRLLASAGNDGRVKLWDAAGGQRVRTLSWNQGWVLSVAFSPDGRRLAGGGSQFDGQGNTLPTAVQIWNVANGTLVRALPGHKDSISDVAFSGDGRLLVSVSDDNTARLWDAATGAAVDTLHGRDAFTSVSFSPDAGSPHLVALGGADGSLKLWDTDARQVTDLRGHGKAVRSVAFRPGSHWLASAGEDKTVKLWDMDTGKELFALPGYPALVHDLAFSPDGRRLATAGHDGMVKLWDMTTHQEVLTLGRSPTALVALAFRPDGRQLAVCSRGDLRLFDAPADSEPGAGGDLSGP